MGSGLLGFMELFIVLAFVIGWGVLELIMLRKDQRRRRAAEDVTNTNSATAEPPSSR
jgi:hypothetical protein